VDLVGEVLAPCLRLGERLTSLAVVVCPRGYRLEVILEWSPALAAVTGHGGRGVASWGDGFVTGGTECLMGVTIGWLWQN
jgi:hypothetical protein